MAALAMRESRGPASAVDLLRRLGHDLPEPEPVAADPAAWSPVEPSDDPIVDFRRELEAAKRADWPFERAWAIARGRVAVRLPSGRFGGYSGLFSDVVNSTKDAWRAAYEGTGERPRYIDMLAAFLLTDDDRGDPIRVSPPA